MNRTKGKISILGSGWLGLALAKQLKDSGYDILLSTTTELRIEQLALLGFAGFLIDIDNDFDDLKQSINNFLSSKILIINIPSKNIQGFKSLIKAVEGSSIEKIIFISSTSVYKDLNTTVYENDLSNLKPSDLLTIEQLFSNNNKFQTTIIRFGGLIGYQRHPSNFLKNNTPLSNPNGKVNMIHRDDCINIIEQVITQQIWGEVFNGVADQHPTREKFYTAAANQMNKAMPLFLSKKTDNYKIVNNDKIKERLNYQFLYPDLMQLFQQGCFI